MSQELKDKAIIIRDETTEGANTADRVGGWMVSASDNINTIESDILSGPPVSYSRFKERITTADGYVLSNGTIITTGDWYTSYKYFEQDIPTGGGVYTVIGNDGGGNANLLLAKLDDGSFVVLLHGDYTTTVRYVSIPKNTVKLLGSAYKTSVLELYRCRDIDNILPLIADRSTSSIFHIIFNNDIFLKESYNQSYNYVTNSFTDSPNWVRTEYQRVNKGDQLLYSGFIYGGDYKGISYFDKFLNPIAFDLGTEGTYTNYVATVPDNDDIYYCIAMSRTFVDDVRYFYLKSPFEFSLNGSADTFKIDLQRIATSADQPFFGSTKGYEVHRPKGSDTASRIYITPNGSPSSLRSKLELFGTDYISDGANYTGLNILVYQNEIHIGGNRNGSQSNSKVIIGAKYLASAMISGCARTEYQVTDQVDMYGTRHTIEKVLRLKPSSVPVSPLAGDIYFDSTTNKHRAYNGTNWNDLY